MSDEPPHDDAALFRAAMRGVRRLTPRAGAGAGATVPTAGLPRPIATPRPRATPTGPTATSTGAAPAVRSAVNTAASASVSKSSAARSAAAWREAAIGSLPPCSADLEVGGDERLSFRRPGLQDSVLRKLRREQFPTEAEIDLHGLTASQAEAALRGFLGTAIARGLRCVRIVHGKGRRSGERGPVLKATVNALLKRSPAVIAFVSASPRHGGAGATSVLLRASE